MAEIVGFAKPVTIEQTGRSGLDQAGSREGAHCVFGETLEDRAINPRPSKHIGCQETRRTSTDHSDRSIHERPP